VRPDLAAEYGFSGVTVVLRGVDLIGLPVLLTGTTSSTGLYLFADIRSGDYSISVLTGTIQNGKYRETYDKDGFVLSPSVSLFRILP
jgi:hypothetical protein